MTEQPNATPAPVRSRPINRRQALAGLGSLGLTAFLAACGKSDTSDSAAASTSSTAESTTATAAAGDVTALLDRSGSCAVVPELTEGPYYIDVDKVRSDIRE